MLIADTSLLTGPTVHLAIERLGEFVVTLAAIESFVLQAWGIEVDLRSQYPNDLTLDVVPTLSTNVMRQRGDKVRDGKYCRDLPFLLRVAAVDGLIPHGRYRILAQ
jgi:hypothetical protein